MEKNSFLSVIKQSSVSFFVRSRGWGGAFNAMECSLASDGKSLGRIPELLGDALKSYFNQSCFTLEN